MKKIIALTTLFVLAPITATFAQDNFRTFSNIEKSAEEKAADARIKQIEREIVAEEMARRAADTHIDERAREIVAAQSTLFERFMAFVSDLWTIVRSYLPSLSLSTASAEWGLYVSRAGSPWKLERTYAFKDVVENSCERSARELWMAQGQGKGNVTAVTCQEYAALNYSPTQQAREAAAAQAERVAQRNAAERARYESTRRGAVQEPVKSEYERRVQQSADETSAMNARNAEANRRAPIGGAARVGDSTISYGPGGTTITTHGQHGASTYVIPPPPVGR